MRALAGLTAVAALAAGMAQAQTWASGQNGDWSGAGVCMGEDGLCLALGCAAGGPAIWDIELPDAALPVTFDGRITVDGTEAGTIAFVQGAQAQIWTAPVRRADDALIARLQQGSRAQIAIFTAGDRLESVMDLGLSRSWVALDAALEACPLRAEDLPPPEPVNPEPVNPESANMEPATPGSAGPATPAAPPPKPGAVAQEAPEPEPVPEPVPPPKPGGTAAVPPPPRAVIPNEATGERSDNPAAAALRTATADCTALGGSLTAQPGFVQMRDIDGDGLNDAMIDFGLAQCSASFGLYCGTGGCQTELWLATPDKDWRALFAGLVQAVDFPAPGEITFWLHGSACGLPGAEPCTARARIADGALVQTD